MITDGVESLHCQFSTDPRSFDGIMPPNLELVIYLMWSPVRLHQGIQQLSHLSLIRYTSITDISVPNATTLTLHMHDLVRFMIQESVNRG